MNAHENFIRIAYHLAEIDKNLDVLGLFVLNRIIIIFWTLLKKSQRYW